jgi:hypothetical protein
MRGIGREIVIDDLALPEAVKVILGVLPSINLVDVDDIERIVVERDAGCLAQALDDRLDRSAPSSGRQDLPPLTRPAPRRLSCTV